MTSAHAIHSHGYGLFLMVFLVRDDDEKKSDECNDDDECHEHILAPVYEAFHSALRVPTLFIRSECPWDETRLLVVFQQRVLLLEA